jgi:hypothetical protein
MQATDFQQLDKEVLGKFELALSSHLELPARLQSPVGEHPVEAHEAHPDEAADGAHARPHEEAHHLLQELLLRAGRHQPVVPLAVQLHQHRVRLLRADDVADVLHARLRDVGSPDQRDLRTVGLIAEVDHGGVALGEARRLLQHRRQDGDEYPQNTAILEASAGSSWVKLYW